NAIGPWFQRLATDLHRDFIDEIRLVFFADTRGITRAINQAGEDQETVGVADSSRVACLHGRDLPAKEDLLRQEFVGDLGRSQEGLLGGSRVGGRLWPGRRNDDGQGGRKQQQAAAKLHDTSPYWLQRMSRP